MGAGHVIRQWRGSLLACLWVLGCGDPKDEAPVCTSCGEERCEEALPPQSANHLPGAIDYTDPPPAGGDHGSCWAPYGTYDTPLGPEFWVHNLEHGAVVFLYDCPEGCEDELEQLRDLPGDQQRTILTPYPELPTRFGAVAWGHRLLSDCLDRDAFERFYSVHFDQAPESVPSGPPANCF